MSFDVYRDVPIQEKHPDWLPWFKENGLNIYTLSTEFSYDPQSGRFVGEEFITDSEGVKVFRKGEYVTRPIDKVVTVPPWEA